MSAIISPEATVAGVFDACRRDHRAALIPFVTAGFPDPRQGVETLGALAEAGADIIELGVPFSDPLADGPTIQLASHQAIRQGVDLAWTLDLLREFRNTYATPVVLFSYLNPILRFGVERFLAEAPAAGAQAILLTDLPVGADPPLERLLERSELQRIRLAAPTSGAERLREIARNARGFLYYISRTGVTGAGAALSDTLAAEVRSLREISPVPVAVGFGVATAAQARTVSAVAEGVVVGSALVERLRTQGIASAAEFVVELRAAMPKPTAGG